MSSSSDLVDRLFLSLVKRPEFERVALRALLKANELLGLALGLRLAELRDAGEPLQAVFAESESNALQARLFHEIEEILAQRWNKIPDKKRPQYTPEQRYRILRIKRLLALSAKETARFFAVSPATITRWEREASSEAESDNDLKLVKPQPPVRRYADVVRELVHSMRLCGFGGYQKIAETLARAGWRISKTTVGRILREKPPSGDPLQKNAPASIRTLSVRFPNDVVLIDLTDVPSFFGLFRFKLAVVFDVFSRMPLAARVFSKEPATEDTILLFHKAVQRFGAPRIVITDQGPQFTSSGFGEALQKLGVRQRFGAIGQVGSIARLERFWRTLKDLLALRVFKPLVRRELEQRLELGLLYYAYFRPHQGLGGATPAEIYFALEPAHLHAIPPPRGQPAHRSAELPFEIRYLDPSRRLPFLINKAA